MNESAGTAKVRHFLCHLEAWFFSGTTAEGLGLQRALFYGYLFAYFSIWPIGKSLDLYLALPAEVWMPAPWMRVLDRSLFQRLGGDFLAALLMVSLLWSALGVAFRLSSIASFFMLLTCESIRQSAGYSSFSSGLPVLAALIFCFAPAADSYALRFSFQRRSVRPNWTYAWPPRLAQICFVLFFFFAGLHKVESLDWIFTDNLRNNILVRYFLGVADGSIDPNAFHLGLWVSGFPLIVKLMAGSAVTLELLSPLALRRSLMPVFVSAFFIFQIANAFVVNERFILFYGMYVFWLELRSPLHGFVRWTRFLR